MLEDLKIRPRYDGFLFLAESARNPPFLRSHRHKELELNLVVSGSITYVVSGCRFTFGRRSLLWMFPAQEHQLVDRTADARYYVAVFTPEMVRRVCTSPRYRGLLRRRGPREGLRSTELEAATFDLVRRTMDSLMVGALDPNILNREAGFGVSTDFRFDHGDPEGLNAGLRHLLLLSWRCQHPAFSPAAEARLHPAVRRALSELADGAADPDLGSLARRCGVSASYLSRLFKTQMGIPLTRYRNSARLARFWEACDDPRNGTVLEAVYSAGFGSYAQFFKVFTAAYGKGPREAGWVPGLRALSRAGRAGGAFR